VKINFVNFDLGHNMGTQETHFFSMLNVLFTHTTKVTSTLDVS